MDFLLVRSVLTPAQARSILAAIGSARAAILVPFRFRFPIVSVTVMHVWKMLVLVFSVATTKPRNA